MNYYMIQAELEANPPPDTPSPSPPIKKLKSKREVLNDAG